MLFFHLILILQMFCFIRCLGLLWLFFFVFMADLLFPCSSCCAQHRHCRWYFTLIADCTNRSTSVLAAAAAAMPLPFTPISRNRFYFWSKQITTIIRSISSWFLDQLSLQPKWPFCTVTATCTQHSTLVCEHSLRISHIEWNSLIKSRHIHTHSRTLTQFSNGFISFVFFYLFRCRNVKIYWKRIAVWSTEMGQARLYTAKTHCYQPQTAPSKKPFSKHRSRLYNGSWLRYQLTGF